MFTQNEHYSKYNKIISNALEQERTKGSEIYYENHHIIPTSIGGGDEPSNLILLTPEEHYICHSLLLDFTSGTDRDSMLYAWNCINGMTKSGKDVDGENVIGSKRYGELKREFAKEASIRFSGENNPRYGKNKGEDNGMFGKTHSQETKNKLSEKKKGFQHTTKSKDKMSEQRKGTNNPRFKQINVYDNDDNLMYENKGNFLDLIREDGLPWALAHSYRGGGYKIYQNGCVPSKYKKYKGWYAKEMMEGKSHLCQT